MTVGQIRSAIQGMPDDAQVILGCGIDYGGRDTETMVGAWLTGVCRDGDGLTIGVSIALSDEGDEGEWDEEEDDR